MSRLLAWLYDPLMRGMERRYGQGWRRELLSGLQGRVLEIGAGTGANLPHYPAGLGELVLSEPDPAMRSQLVAKLASAPPAVRHARVSDLALEEIDDRAGFEAIVGTLVLCTVPNLDRAAEQIYRLLKPGGKLIFLEHVAAESDPNALAWQERLDPLWHHVAGGCNLARRTEAALRRAGFQFERLDHETMPKAPRVVRHLIRGVALKPIVS